MGNTSSSPAPQNNNKPAAQHCEVRAEHQDSHGITPNDASVVAVKGNASGPVAYTGHKPVIFSLNVTLSCSEDGTKRERELGLTRIPARDDCRPSRPNTGTVQHPRRRPEANVWTYCAEWQGVASVVQLKEWRQYNRGVLVRI